MADGLEFRARRALDLVERLLDFTAHTLLLREALEGEVVDRQLEERGGGREQGEEEFGCCVVHAARAESLPGSRQLGVTGVPIGGHHRGDRELRAFAATIEEG
jgi:hypothetical protein